MTAMDWKTRMNFEIYVQELAESLEIHDADDLEWLSNVLHQHLEIGLSDYAMDEDISDYEPQY